MTTVIPTAAPSRRFRVIWALRGVGPAGSTGGVFSSAERDGAGRSMLPVRIGEVSTQAPNRAPTTPNQAELILGHRRGVPALAVGTGVRA
ncbi:hypothetical protein [Actinoalloteichus sp. GBA129-24]|uniref:hypothetical protein n=1 Tax=Actinoalloteichus sp. GBA129-24 TaxID=1612551 RepID=UPI0009506BD8|nr:hypothetical protein [Actinoalloteichus sp. GBA129-24]APU23242.1 hypothetical protein UA75_26345 [Actinoalloteichus sp. GBA129-24]